MATVGVVAMWFVFWIAAARSGANIADLLLSPAFFRTTVVIGAIAATAVLALAGRLQANLTGAILSGIVGYVLGSTQRR